MSSHTVIAGLYICVTMPSLPLYGRRPMSPSKTATLNLRIDPRIKEAVRIAALREHRSIANLIEVLIRKHCDANGISIPEQHALFGETDDE